MYKKENGGASSARNYGLKKASQKYITFLDCDDTLDLDMYEVLMKYFESGKYDIVHCGYKRIKDDKVIKEVNGTGKEYIQDNLQALECLIDGRLFVGALWNKIYKRELFNNIEFDESLKINEDILVNYKVFNVSKKSIFIDISKYNYYERSESVCVSTNDIRKCKDSLNVASKIYNDCKGTKLEGHAEDKYLNSLLNLYRCNYFNLNRGQHYNENKELRIIILSYLKDNKFRSEKSKISAMLLCYIPKIYKLIYKVYDRYRVPNWDV